MVKWIIDIADHWYYFLYKKLVTVANYGERETEGNCDQ